MNDIEDLLRTTLDDPARRISADPGHLDSYRGRARSLHRRRTVTSSIAVAATIAAVVGVGIAVSRPDSKAPNTPPASTSSSLPISPGPLSAQTLGDIPDAVDAVYADGWLWVLSRFGSVHKLDPATGRYESSPRPLGSGPTGIVAGESVWTWAWDGQARTELHEFDPITLRERRSLPLLSYVFSAAMLRGELWLGTQGGLYRIAKLGVPERIGDYQPFAIAADARRGQLLLGVDPYVVRFDPATGKEVARVDIGLGKISLALTGNRQLWAAGYDIPGPVDRRVVHLDAETLAVVGTTPINTQIEAGASVYAGESVVWVENNGNHVTCVDANTGAVASTGLDGNYRVGSVAGFGYRVNFGVQRLTLPASCPG
ncbi:MAG: hypothetical protein ABI912_07150 [Actinomycetota bacterium]